MLVMKEIQKRAFTSLFLRLRHCLLALGHWDGQHIICPQIAPA